MLSIRMPTHTRNPIILLKYRFLSVDEVHVPWVMMGHAPSFETTLRLIDDFLVDILDAPSVHGASRYGYGKWLTMTQ